MRTDDLISQLSEGLHPVRKTAVAATLAVGLIGGIIGSALLMVATMGIRPDLATAIAGGAFWMKFTYTLVIAALGLWIVERLGRPGAKATQPFALLVLPVVAILVLVAIQLAPANADRHALIMGHTAKVCALLIMLLAIPLFGGIFWALRQLAPTRLKQAGAAAGLLAGGAAATIYAFHCPESAAPFVALWYSLGMIACALLGWALGPMLLRWR